MVGNKVPKTADARLLKSVDQKLLNSVSGNLLKSVSYRLLNPVGARRQRDARGWFALESRSRLVSALVLQQAWSR